MNKLEFLITKLVNEVGRESLETLSGILCERYPEYQRKPPEELRQSIHDILTPPTTSNTNTSQINVNNGLISQPTATMSMNRSLTSNYQKKGLSMKVVKLFDEKTDQINTQPVIDTTVEATTSNDDVIATISTQLEKIDNIIDKSITSKKRRVSRHPESEVSLHGIIDDISTIEMKYFVSRPSSRLSDLAGLEKSIMLIKEMAFYPVMYPTLYTHLGVYPPCGLLLTGPSGVGKTSLAYALAGESGLPFYKVTGPELIGGTSGESEQNIRQLFNTAMKHSPSIIFIDNIDAIAGIKDSSQRGMDKRIIAQFFDCMDAIVSFQDTTPTIESSITTSNTTNMSSSINEESNPLKTRLVIVIAATNRADSLDAGLRGRFTKEISLSVPDAEARSQILHVLSRSMTLASDVDFNVLGKNTPGYVGADLKALLKEAGTLAVKRIVACYNMTANNTDTKLESMDSTTSSSYTLNHINHQSNLSLADYGVDIEDIRCTIDAATLFVTMDDFTKAAKTIQPTAKREGFAVVPDVTWEDVGALAEVRDELLQNFLKPIANPARFRRLGLEVPAGVIFYGPPGCGKTLLAKALANESGANFISVKGPELLNMYVGESESKVRQVFARARASTPCMIFFDELDALVPKRGATEGGSGVSERVVNQFLTELDGLEERRDVYVVAATNRLELIDEAMLRPGRLGKLLYVPLPLKEERVSILKALTRKVSLDPNGVDIDSIAGDKRTEGFSGADLASLVREAGMAVVKEWADDKFDSDDTDREPAYISFKHFEIAFTKVRPSVSANDKVKYDRVHSCIRQGMGALEALRAAISKDWSDVDLLRVQIQ